MDLLEFGECRELTCLRRCKQDFSARQAFDGTAKSGLRTLAALGDGP